MHQRIILLILRVIIQSTPMVKLRSQKRSHRCIKERILICTILFKTLNIICHRFSKRDSNQDINNITSRIWLMSMSQSKGRRMLDLLGWSVLRRSWSWDATKMLTCRTILWIELHWFTVSSIQATTLMIDNTMVDITFKTTALITHHTWCLLQETVLWTINMEVVEST